MKYKILLVTLIIYTIYILNGVDSERELKYHPRSSLITMSKKISKAVPIPNLYPSYLIS